MIEKTPGNAPVQESIVTREELEKELQIVKQKRDALLARQEEFYDKKLLELYVDATHRLLPNAVELYINAMGENYEKVLENFDTYRQFEEQELSPLRKQVSAIEFQIASIVRKEREANAQELEQQKKKEFEQEKNTLSDKLYTALDAIHATVAEQVKNLGMTTEAALEVYAPALVSKVKTIESYIEYLEDAHTPYRLENLKKEIEARNIVEL